MSFRSRLKHGIILFDGAMGTQIQALNPTDDEWAGKQGCSEVLNLTAPEKIQHIHEAYFEAGSDVVETNTFGANEIVLSEYELQDRTQEINRIAAQIARRAANKHLTLKPRFVAGSIGPGTRLITLNQTDFPTMYHSYLQQAKGLVEGGVDLFIIETCQDLLQIKIALLAVQDAMAEMNYDAPIIVSVTVETTGTLLVGSEMNAVLTALAPFKIDALGMNCATGPKHMSPYIRQICQTFDGPVLCQPNAGLPENIGGEMVYALPISEFVDELTRFVSEEGVQIIGGCCGTNPDFIRLLADRIQTLEIASGTEESEPAVASLFSSFELHQDPAPFFIGERANTSGSKKFRKYLLDNDWDGVVAIARQQQRTGAHGLDLCVAYTGRDEAADMIEAVKRIVRQVNLPLFIDSTTIDVIEKALQLYGGRAVINSINLEDGEPRADKICKLAKRYGAALIALTIDEDGMAMTVEKKLSVARRLYDIAVNRHGLRPQDLIFDALTFTLGSGDETLEKSAIHTIEAIRSIKKAMPGVFTSLGVSNVSFGLNPYSREILNSVFLAEAVNAGLDMAIVNVKKILPLYKIDKDDREHCLNLIYNRGSKQPLLDFIKHFDKKAGVNKKEELAEEKLSLDDKIKQRVLQGNSSGLEKMLLDALKTKQPFEIINQLLIPAMKQVGDLFGAGEMQLPFVLQSAEVMKFSVDKLEPFMEKSEDEVQKSIVLATVRGDVHDIGKNLVDIILSNNGYKVYNLGIKCEIDTMIEKALRVNADAVGMSGLLVKSTVVMKENLEEMQHRGLRIPVLLGGAALTESYVKEVCAPVLDAPVVYCTDAFEGLNVMDIIKSGDVDQLNTLSAPASQGKKARRQTFGAADEKPKISRKINIPQPPFWGDKIIDHVDLDIVFSYLTEVVLFRGRWGFRRGKLSREEYNSLIENEVRPAYEELKQRCKTEELLQPKVVYGYYPCNSEGDQVILYKQDGSERLRFNFPRQIKPPHQCIADFFLPVNTGQKDLIALQVATVGKRASVESQRLFKTDQYKNYLMFHGLSVETAESLAEYWHRIIREELNITEEDEAGMESMVVQKYRGSRYSFGYPACPDLAENRKIFDILKPQRIGVTLTDEDQMTPEQTTSAFVVHHPQAKYFTIE